MEATAITLENLPELAQLLEQSIPKGWQLRVSVTAPLNAPNYHAHYTSVQEAMKDFPRQQQTAIRWGKDVRWQLEITAIVPLPLTASQSQDPNSHA